ncbi:MAG: glutamine synthetase III, partial [Candidatus Heimdallarchaeota archaeon]|nr:glutamine synthetase III [Candidatus Heimdallarchaeota archaeon]
MKISEIFGMNTFNQGIMKEKLPKNVFEKLVNTMEIGEPLDINIADSVAHAMKEWALEQGATHYCHWFQPLSRGTAEKHDSFLSPESLKNGKVIERFNRSQLVQAEPDASSFPSGGMRTTFEARGYTAWDPTTPAFIIKRAGSSTLCIPSVFTSYNGDALDKKTPLLRSIKVLNETTKNILETLGSKTSGVYPTLGVEQEYFLIPKDMFEKRPDLKLTGRTLIGMESPKGQKLEDHYFGTIKDNVLEFMNVLETEAYKLGIPITTRHNEVAPCQFEFAPIFQNSNISNDQNRLLMEIMPGLARKYGFECLFHEKPFNWINGSGKHNNWSIMTYEGKNLLDPGTSFDEQLDFLIFIVIVLHGINKRSDLLRASIAPPGNDFRLGANEAPPGIISIFLGDTITSILDRISKGEFTEETSEEQYIKFGLNQLPDLVKDNTDRNRTSPFAFTGNKFEFRAVGSSQSVGFPNTFLNAIISESMDEVNKYLTKTLNSKEPIEAKLATIKYFYNKSKPIVFNGNNYGEDWVIEANSRGLVNKKNSYEALLALNDDKNLKFLDKIGILTQREMSARFSIDIHHLRRIIEIEANTLVYMVKSGVVPTLLRYIKEIGMDSNADSVLSKSNAYM